MTVDVISHTGSGTFSAWTVNVGGTTPLQSVLWGDVTGTLGDQTDLATALGNKLETSGGTLTTGGTITASTATVNSLFAGDAFGVELTANPSQNASLQYDGVQVQNALGSMLVTASGLTFPNSTTQSTAFPGFTGYAALSGATFTGEVSTPASTTSSAGFSILPGTAPSSPTNGEFWNTGSDLQIRLGGVTETLAEQSWVSAQGYITSSALTPYAPLAGATFTGLVTTAVPTTSSAFFNLPHGTAPSAPNNGDVWSTTGGLFWRQNGSTYQAMNLSATQTVSGNITFSNASLTLGNSTAASTYNIGTGATLTATTKAINIGTNGVSGSTTNITLGSSTGTNAITLNGPTTLNGTISTASTSITLGNNTAATAINIGTGATLSGVAKSVNIGTAGVAGSTTTIAIGSTTGTSTTTLNGTTNGVTAAADTNSTALATTAFVVGQAGSATPIVDGTAAVGTSLRYARQDHVHPTDTSRAPLASPSLTGTPLSTTAAADTNTTQIATTAYVVGQASSTAPVVDGTAAVGTSLKYARADHVHPTDTSRASLASPSLTGTPLAPTAAVDTNTTQIATTAYVVGQGYAKLASPSFSGTPSLPTGTTAVTQTAGNNTTAVATTAFVQAALPVAATIDQVRTGSSTTTSINPNNLQAAMMSSDVMPVYRFGFTSTTSGTGAGCTFGYTNTFYNLPSTGSSGHSYARTYGLSQVDQLTNLWGDDANVYINFAKRIWISGRSLINLPTQNNYVCRVSFGKTEASGVGDLALRGIGWKYTCGTSQFVQLMVHNGTTLTTVNSSFTPSNVAFDWDVVSDGAGNVTLYINGASVATTSAGPSTRAVDTQCLYQEETALTGASINGFTRFYCARGSIFVQR
jgi:hypothetical protein